MNTHTNTYIKSVESPITVSVLKISKFARLKCLYNKYWQGKNFKWNSDCLCTSAWMAWTFVCWQASNFIFENIDRGFSLCCLGKKLPYFGANNETLSEMFCGKKTLLSFFVVHLSEIIWFLYKRINLKLFLLEFLALR